MKCLIHKDYEPSDQPRHGCLRCWAIWLEEQGRLERSLNPADLACIMRDLLEIINAEYGRHLVETPTR